MSSEAEEKLISFLRELPDKYKDKNLSLEERLKILCFYIEYNDKNLPLPKDIKEMYESMVFGWYVKSLINS